MHDVMNRALRSVQMAIGVNRVEEGMNAPRESRLITIALLMAVLVDGKIAFAQDEHESIHGRILNDGKPVPRGRVQMRSDDGKVHEAIIKDGNVSIPDLPPGEYHITVTIPGSQKTQTSLSSNGPSCTNQQSGMQTRYRKMCWRGRSRERFYCRFACFRHRT